VTENASNATAPASRGARMAAALDDLNARIAATIEGCSEEQWRRPTAAEGWPVGVVAHHVAEVQRFFAGVLAGAGGEPEALTSAFVEENNARHAREAAGVGKDETLALLRAAGAEAARALRGLDDDRLGAAVLTFDGRPLTAAQAAEHGMIGHFEDHLASIRATLAA
jgi:uncharacterized protein (TIGR03083 family)